jgi:hypothetical protein
MFLTSIKSYCLNFRKRYFFFFSFFSHEKKTHCLKRANVQYVCLENKKASLTQSLTLLIAQHHTKHTKNDRSFTILASLPALKKTYTRISTSRILIHFPKTTLDVSTLCEASYMSTKAIQTLSHSCYDSRVKFSQCKSLKINLNSSFQHHVSLFKRIQKLTPIQLVSPKHSIMPFCRTTVQSVQRISYPLILTKNFFVHIIIEASIRGTRDIEVSKKQTKPFDDSNTKKNFSSYQSVETIHRDVLHNSSFFLKRNHSISTCELSEDVSCVSGTLASSCSPLRNTLPFQHIRFIQNPSPRILPFIPKIKTIQSQDKIFTFQKEQLFGDKPTTCTVVSPQSFSQQNELFRKQKNNKNILFGTFSQLSPSPARKNNFFTVINKKSRYTDHTGKLCKYKNDHLFLNPQCVYKNHICLKKFRKYQYLKKKFKSKVQLRKSTSLRYVQLDNKKMQPCSNNLMIFGKPCISLRTELHLLFFTLPVSSQVIGTQTDFLKPKNCLKNPVLKRHSDMYKEKTIKLHSSTKEIV